MTPFAGYRVPVAEACVTGEVCATTVDDVIGGAADAPVEVLSEDRLHHCLVSCAVKQLSFDQRRRSRLIISGLNLLPLANQYLHKNQRHNHL